MAAKLDCFNISSRVHSQKDAGDHLIYHSVRQYIWIIGYTYVTMTIASAMNPEPTKNANPGVVFSVAA